MRATTLIGSLALGISIAVVLSKLVIPSVTTNWLFDTQIPGVTKELSLAKTFDLLEMGLSIIICSLIIAGNYFFLNKANKESFVTDMGYLLFTVIIYLQAHFTYYSPKLLIVIALAGQLIYWGVNYWTKRYEIKFNLNIIRWGNGIFAAVYLILVLHLITTNIPLTFLALVILPLIFAAFENTFADSPGWILGILAIFNPLNKFYLLGVGLLMSLGILSFKKYSSKKWLTQVYICGLIFLLVYNPLFYIGNFDSVEEGFWLGWIQQLNLGHVLYRDVAVYHPPLVIWGMYGFMKTVGLSIFSARLYLHLLQIAGIIVIYQLTAKLIKQNIFRIGLLLTIIGIIPVTVKNNVEFRLASGVLAIILWYKAVEANDTRFYTISGIAAAAAIFVSPEVGIAAAGALFMVMLINKNLKNLRNFCIGIIAGGLPFAGILAIQGALPGFINQIGFYAAAFSKGYFNVPMDRPVILSYLHWHIVNQFFSSTAWYWDITKISILGGIGWAAIKWFRKEITKTDYLAGTVGIFSLILFRSALGRSDWYHMLFVLIPGLILLGYITEQTIKTNKTAGWLFALLLIGIFFRNEVNGGFIENKLYQIQTYGKVLGDYKKYSIDRENILVGQEIKTNETDKLVNFLNSKLNNDDPIFVYPWGPEIYFLSNRRNATKIDTPYAFYTQAYQNQMVADLTQQQPKFVIFNPDKNFGGMDTGSLPTVRDYIKQNYKEVERFGENVVLMRD